MDNSTRERSGRPLRPRGSVLFGSTFSPGLTARSPGTLVPALLKPGAGTDDRIYGVLSLNDYPLTLNGQLISLQP